MTDIRTAYYDRIDTAMGPMLLAGSGRSLVAIKFNVPATRLAAAVEALHDELQGSFALVADARRVAPLAKQVAAYLAGRRTAWDLELDLSWLTPFRRDVLMETFRVPRGQVATYGDIARRVGKPLAYRAVGNTMRTNPIPIVIPCHRIIGSGGTLGGFGGGLDLKRQLLALEGADGLVAGR